MSRVKWGTLSTLIDPHSAGLNAREIKITVNANKSAKRLALLKYRAAVLGVVPIWLMPVSASEVREEVKLATQNEVSNSILDDDLDGWEPEIASSFDRARVAKESETEILLSRNDRAQIKIDLYNARLAERMPYAIVLRVERPADEQELDAYRELSHFAQI